MPTSWSLFASAVTFALATVGALGGAPVQGDFGRQLMKAGRKFDDSPKSPSPSPSVDFSGKAGRPLEDGPSPSPAGRRLMKAGRKSDDSPKSPSPSPSVDFSGKVGRPIEDGPSPSPP